MRRGLVHATLVLLVFVCAAAHSAPVVRIHEIQKPLFSAPVFVRAGESFEMELKLDGKTLVGATLVSADAKDDVKLVLSPDADNPAVFKASVPADTSEALYDLKVAFSDGTSDMQPHAVKVLKEFKKEFDFIHITDIHFNIGNYEKGDPNKIRVRLLQDITQLKPEFVIFTGDLALSPANYDVDYPYHYEKFVENINSPFFTIPGNHDLDYLETEKGDIDGVDYWRVTYGPFYNSFDYGGIHFLGMNTHDWPDSYRKIQGVEGDSLGLGRTAVIGDRQWAWIKEDVNKAAQRGYKILAFTHIPVEFLQGGAKLGNATEKMEGPSASQFISFMNKFGISQVYVGHVHFNSERKLGGAAVEVITEGAGIDTKKTKDPHWGFRIVHVREGKVVGSDIHEIGFEDIE